MPERQFDFKIFNPEVFARYVERLPNLRKNAIIQAGIFELRPDLAAMFPAQTGGNFATIPMFDYLKGETVNYDGVTDITTNTQETFQQSIVVKGEAAGFEEKDFSYSINGVNWIDDVAHQIPTWRQEKDEELLMSIVKGIFSMTGAGNDEFVERHTYDITTASDPSFSPVTLNIAMQRASGDNRGQFTLAIAHSTVVSRMENLNLIEFLKFTDNNGVTSDLRVGTLNGRTIIEYDGVPHDYDTGTYTTLVFGRNAFINFDAPVLNPYSSDRNERENGGKESIYVRFRRCFAPRGISFTKSSMATLSPTHAEFEMGANWELVYNQQSGAKKRFFNHKAIPIARIITREE